MNGNPTRPVVFWWNTPSIHMEPCLSAFSRSWDAPTLAVWSQPLSSTRRSLGWRDARLEGMQSVTLPAGEEDARTEIRGLMAEHPGAIHVYSGWRGHERACHAFRLGRMDPAAFHVVVAEPFRGWGLRRSTRHVRALWQTLPYRSRIDAILAISAAGEQFYRELGFPGEMIYPFMYQSPPGGAHQVATKGDASRLVYVGQLEPRKGLDHLLAALGRLRHLGWSLTVVGDGPRRSEFQSQALHLGLDGRIDWKGRLPSDSVPACLARHDLAIVPSRFDGWGVVTNEALQAGVPVVVSDRTGSCDLVKASGAGRVFRAGDVPDLASALEGLLTQPAILSAMKDAATRYRPSISGESVAGYLARLLARIAVGGGSPPPRAPWTRRDEVDAPDRWSAVLRETGA